MEHRIGTLKRLIGNLGPNFDKEHVQLVNKVVETESSKEKRKSGPKVDLVKESKDTAKSGRSSKGKEDGKNSGKVKSKTLRSTESDLNLLGDFDMNFEEDEPARSNSKKRKVSSSEEDDDQRGKVTPTLTWCRISCCAYRRRKRGLLLVYEKSWRVENQNPCESYAYPRG